jgi:predicted phage terminase large subunit-like protein
MDIDELEERQVLQVECKDDFLFFIQYFFKKIHGKRFVTNSHHEIICSTMEKVMSGDITRLIINIAPRYGKTEVAVKNFIAHCLAVNPAAKFLHLSYSQELALDNSEEVRDMIRSHEYQELFPNVQIKHGSTAKKKWFTTAGGGIYATSAGGQVTGFGAGEVDDDEEKEIEEFFTESKDGFAGAIIIDDPIKPDDADSVLARDKINNKFDSTVRSRANSRKTPIIIIMQRLHPSDLCGHVVKDEDWTILSLPCLTEVDGVETSLWEHKDTVEELHKKRILNKIVFERQYQQDPKPLEGLLYTQFLTYDSIDFEIKEVSAYVDVADTGQDYLCCIIHTTHLNMRYILDIYYTQEPNEVTENEVANRFAQHNVNYAKTESNAGGRGFGRNVQRICIENGNYKTMFQPFHQSGNKVSRIINGASLVQNTVMYPSDWDNRWVKFYDSMTSFMKKTCQDLEGHDDAQDTITGIVEDTGMNIEVEIDN